MTLDGVYAYHPVPQPMSLGSAGGAERILATFVTEAERVNVSALYEEIARMAAGLIRHLEQEDRKHRR